MLNWPKFKPWRYTKFDSPTDSGSPVKVNYVGQYNKQGIIELVENGTENIYDFIQSFKDSVDINVIMARYRAGDVNALQRAQGFFFDATDLPKDMVGMFNTINNIELEFSRLPVDVKEQYGNDPVRFMLSLQDIGSVPGVAPVEPTPVPSDEKVEVSDES